MLPVVATGDVDDGYSKSALEFHYPSGEVGLFAFRGLPSEVSEFNEALIDLRDDMLANGSEPWWGYTLIVESDGRLDMDLSYEPIEE